MILLSQAKDLPFHTKGACTGYFPVLLIGKNTLSLKKDIEQLALNYAYFGTSRLPILPSRNSVSIFRFLRL